jgi:hypothetical protein
MSEHRDNVGPPQRPAELRSEQLALWIHYQELAGDDKNKMIAIASWLFGIGVGLLVVSVGELFPGKEGTRPWVALLLSLVSIALGLVAVYLVVAFARHAAGRYEAANKLAVENFPEIEIFRNKEGRFAKFVGWMDWLTEPKSRRLFKDNTVGAVFDNLVKLSIGIVFLGCLTLCASLVILAMQGR